MDSATIPVERSSGATACLEPSGLALAVADAGWFSTENLFREIDRDSVAVLLLKCLDYVNGWRRGIYPWSRACRLGRSSPAAWEQQFVLPSGWMKRYPSLGMWPIARSVRAWWELFPSAYRRGLVMSYPHYIHLHNRLRPDVSVYYNVDDYSLYWPRWSERIRALEREVVRMADATICVSRLRADELRSLVPERASRIHHLPHGAPTSFLAARPLVRPAEAPADLALLPRPYLGYIGSLEDRVDWELMDRVSREFPGASIVVVGRIKTSSKPWWDACARFLDRPNVHALGWRPQETVAAYYQAFDVCMIPYRIDHPFNQACNPTKIMDALGSGRPIVATAIPECRLHSDRFHVVDRADAFVAAVHEILCNNSDDGRAALRHAYARANSCREVGERILNVIEQVGRGSLVAERTVGSPVRLAE
jgi:teichuronic acid biosynthesis glycosyltransferase TuaH